MPSLHGRLHDFPGASVDLTDPRIGVLLPDLVMTAAAMARHPSGWPADCGMLPCRAVGRRASTPPRGRQVSRIGVQPERNAIDAPASWLLRVSGWCAEKSLAALGAFPPLSSRLLGVVDGVGAEAAASRTRRRHASTLGRLCGVSVGWSSDHLRAFRSRSEEVIPTANAIKDCPSVSRT